jgi:hypothetical protein
MLMSVVCVAQSVLSCFPLLFLVTVVLIVSESRTWEKHSTELQEPFDGRPLGSTSCSWLERHGHQICGEVGGASKITARTRSAE